MLTPLVALVCAFGLPPVPPARTAAAIVVTGLGDTIATDGVYTLREAITAANTNLPAGDCPAGTPNTDTITIAASLNAGYTGNKR
jgi:hypothetical protein